MGGKVFHFRFLSAFSFKSISEYNLGYDKDYLVLLCASEKKNTIDFLANNQN